MIHPAFHSVPFGVAMVAAIAFVASAAFTPIVSALARRMGAVAMPRADRWHAKPTAMMGGIAIFIAAMATILVFQTQSRASWTVLGVSSALFVFGLLDDVLEFKPYQKLIAQLMAAGVVIYFGLILTWTGSALLNTCITFLWLMGITNAINLLDNMDGLAAGIAAVAATFLGLNFFLNGQMWEPLALAAFVGALLGFLIYNHNPASIFMGDCGSMFIGFFLGSTTLLSGTGGGRSRSIVAVLAVPVLVLFVPIFDTTFVALMRKLAGRSMMKGGRDHTSHRLVALGLSEKHAVWLLYALALSGGLLSLFVRNSPYDVSAAVIGGFVIVLTFLGVHLGRVRVYEEAELALAREKPLVSFLFDVTYKSRIFEVALDVVLISLAYYVAYALRFGAIHVSADWELFVRTLPIVVCLKLVTFLAAGVYRGIWRYASLSNVIDIARAVGLSSVATLLLIVFAFKFYGFSRTVFAFDAILLMTFVTASRFAFRILRRLFPVPYAEKAKRVLIYGAGDGGELVFRELYNNPELKVIPVAFLDDDPIKFGRLVHGLPVYPGLHPIVETLRRLQVDEIMISSAKIRADRLSLMVSECGTLGIPVKRAHMRFETISSAELGWVLPSEDMTEPVTPIVTQPAANLVRPPRVTTGH